jgi:Ca2+-binding EF-hand superfamily protein
MTTGELRFVMRNLPEDSRLTEAEVDEMIMATDADGDGIITYEGT